MNIEKAKEIINNMYQEKMHSRDIEDERGITIDLSKEVKFTSLEEASVILLRKYNRLKEDYQIESSIKLTDIVNILFICILIILCIGLLDKYYGEARLDVNDDGKITASDYVEIKNYIMSKE